VMRRKAEQLGVFEAPSRSSSAPSGLLASAGFRGPSGLRTACLVALTLSTIACTRTITRVDYVRVPCLPSEAPPIPTADFDTDEWAGQYVALLGWAAYVAKACAVPEVEP
jgi:hypothetical protein